jgi:hypothetical protein
LSIVASFASGLAGLTRKRDAKQSSRIPGFTAFTGSDTGLAENLVNSVPHPGYHLAMKVFYPGQVVLPLLFLLAEGLFLMSRFDIIRVGWPVALIAAGLEELYLWATSRDDK